MKILVKDIFRYGNSNMKLIAGEKGLEKEIKVVSLFDSPDFHQALDGGEFLITTCYIIKDNPLVLKEYIKKMHDKGVVALGIKLKYINSVPPGVIEVAESLDFPLIIIPIDMKFIDVNYLLEEIIKEHTQNIALSLKIYEDFEDIILQGKDIQSVINVVYKFIDRDIAFYHTSYHYIYISDIFVWQGKDTDFLNDLKDLELDDILRKYRSYPVRVDGKTYGYIVLSNLYTEEIGDYIHKLLNNVKIIINIILQKKISNYQIERKYRDQFIYDLVNNNFGCLEEILDKGKIYNWQFGKQYIAIVVEFLNKKGDEINIGDLLGLDASSSRILMKIKKIINNNFNSIYSILNRKILFIIEVESQNQYGELKNILRKCQDYIIKTEKYINIKVGVGLYKETIKDIHQSYAEALKALNFSKSNENPDDIIYYSDLGVYKLLDEIDSETIKKKFYCEYLGHLIVYDKENRTEYLKTLEVLEKNDWNMNAAAKKLNVHYNTVKYRLGKICNILKRDLSDSKEKLAISLALRINKLK